jgi:hypothetical protein
METSLLQRGYPITLIKHGIQKACDLSIDTLRTPKDKSDENVSTFVTTYNPNNVNMWNIVQNSIGVLSTDTRCNKLMNHINLINSRRQPPNLKKLLTSAKFDSNQHIISRCSDKRCGTCHFLHTGQHFTFKGSQEPFYVKTSMNCGTENLLYVLQCQGCLENYIGQTSGPLRARIRVHKQHINQPQYRKIAVSKHIAECAGDMDPPFKVFPFYKVMNSDKSFRDVKEQTFIKIFKPLLNSSS